MEWLSSSIALGASMLVKVKAKDVAKDGPQSIDIPFPSNCRLCAANNIIGQLFTGKGYYGGDNSASWAYKVSEYSPLIQNDGNASPNGVVNNNWPKKADAQWEDAKRDLLVDYMKLLEGVILQPGTWSENSNKPPQKQFSPDLLKPPVLRLLFVDKIKADIELVLTGFTDRSVIRGETAVDDSLHTLHPENGDYLGPTYFPWAVKIDFAVPSATMSYFMLGNYHRKIPKTAGVIKVDDTGVIDMRTTDPATYYAQPAHNASRVEINVVDYASAGKGDAVLTVYQKPSASGKFSYPPAIWGTYLTKKGDNFLHPLDTVAPGNVKMFPHTTDEQDQQQLQDYQNTFPETWGMVHNDDGTFSGLDNEGNLQKSGDMSIKDLNYTNPSGSSEKAKAYLVKSGPRAGLMLAAAKNMTTDGSSPTQYTIGNETVQKKTVGNTEYDLGAGLTKYAPSSSDINWASLLDAFANNKAIDILGEHMKILKAGLSKATPYIQFNTGLRLYISNVVPPDRDVPVGSIGIGW